MAKYSNVVTYDIKTTLDASGITKLQSELAKVQSTINSLKGQKGLKLGLSTDELEGYRHEIEKLSTVLNTTFNTRTGMLDLNKFNAALHNGTLNAERLGAAFNAAGGSGKIAFNSLVTSITTLNKNAITANSTLTKIANTFGNTVRWGITASIFQEMMSSVQGAVSYMKDLDESLTQIQMVTNSSKEDMRELAQYANVAAQALGSTTTDYTNAVKVFVQEGFSERESKQYANLSTKLANVSEQDTQTTSDQITAYRNAFQLDYKQTVEAMDKVANVANSTASNVNELMTASQRSASVANAVNASQDSFLASIATIESVTRQSAEEIGNGLKTIYQRMADIKVSGKTDDGVDYGQYATTLKEVGVDILDANREIKSFDQILTELQAVWGDLSDTMKQAVGQKVAGKFQYNRFVALMDNPEYYQKAYNATQGASGMMDQMNDIYIESIEGRLNTLRAAGEQIMSTLFDQDNVEPIIEAATKLLNIINGIVDSVGGGLPVFTALGALMTRIFSAQIGEQAARIATNITTMMQGSQNTRQMNAILSQLEGSGNTQTFDFAKRSSTLMAGVNGNTQQQWSDTVAKSAEIENKMLATQQEYKAAVEQSNAKLNSRYKTTAQLLDIEAAIEGAEGKELETLQRIQAILKDELILDEENFSIDENQLKVQIALQKILNQNKHITWEDAEALAQKVALSKDELTQEELQYALDERDLQIVRERLQISQQLNQAQNEHNTQLRVEEELEEKMRMEQQGSRISNTISALTTVLFLYQAISSAVATWSDENASVEEKVGATLMELAMILPLVASGFSAVKNALAGTVVMEGITAAATAVLEKVLGTTAVAATGLNAALLANPVGAMIAGITALAAVITGVAVVAFVSWQESIHAASREFEEQKELLSKTKKAYTDAADEVEALKNSLDSIGESRSSLDNLTKGTDEWRAAVRKLNDEILTLLETYPELAQYVTNKDGLLSLDEAGANKFYQQQLNEADHLANVNSIQQIKTLQAQNDKFVEDFSNRWGLSKEDISTAIQEGAVTLEGESDLLNSAFVELRNSLETNSLAIDNLSDNVGTLNNTYTDYSGQTTENTEEQIAAARQAIIKEYGNTTYDTEGNAIKTDNPDFSVNEVIDNQDFLNAVAEATGEKILGARDTSFFDDNVAFKTASGDEIEYSSKQLLDLLADSQAAIDLTNQKLEENKTIYEAFGAQYDEVTRSFIDSSGKAVNSLDDLEGASTDEIAAIKAFQDGIYNDIAFTKFNGSLEEFVMALQSGSLDVRHFSEALLAAQVREKEGTVSEKLGGLTQTQGVMATLPDGTIDNIKLSPEQAQAIMSDMMRQLNESSLSNEEKLQLMDKINWDMPVQDILANIQKAIDTGNVEAAFIDTAGLEDDSERKTQVSQEYNIDESTLNAYTEQLQTTGELARQHEELANALEQSKRSFGEGSEEVKEARNALAAFDDESEDIAVDLAQTQKGLESLSDNMAEYGDVLKKGDRTTLEYAEALGKVKGALADTLNVSEDSLSNNLIQNNLEDIEALAAGDEEALNRLRAAAGQDIAMGFYMSEDSNLTEDHLDYLQQKATEIAGLDIEVGAAVDDEQFINTLNEMMANGELTKDQVNAYLHSIGVEPHMETENVPTEIFSTRGMFVEIPMPFGAPPAHINVPEFSVFGNVGVPKITAGESKSGGSTPALRRTASPTAPSGKSGISPNYVNDNYKPKGGNKGKSPKKGSGSNKNNQKKDKEKSQWDYLTDITNDLDRAADVMEKMARLEDRLYGKNRISQIKKLQSEYKSYIKLLQQEVQIAEKHAKRLRTKARDENGNLTINGYAYRAGIRNLKFDAQGNLDNGRQIEQALLKRVNSAVSAYNKHRNDEDNGRYEYNLNQAKSDYDGFLKAMKEYEETISKVEDTKDEIQEYKEKIQDATDAIVDAIQEGVEDMVKAMDNQREFNKLARDWAQGGSGYSHLDNDRRYYSEGLANLFTPTANGASVFDIQQQSLSDRIADARKVLDGNPSNADDEKLSEQAAFENLQEATENVLSTLQDAIKYYDSLLDTVEEASSKMDDLIDGRLEEFNKLEDYLDTRLDQLKLLFGDKSYENQTLLYNQKIEANMERMVSINAAIEAKQATVEALERLEASGKELSTEEREVLQNARDKVTELQEQQLETESKLLQDISEKLRAQTSAEMDKAVREMFNGADVDWLSQQWEIATRNSEKYFDDYNRAFETQKLQLKFQEALNDSQNNSLATQQKIASLANEYLTYLQEKNNLSEYDVKHAQMELDILQKQIALEDARDNKSQMRLQRNAAGNYDFVYAADEDAIAKANEALLAAQQESYNLSKQKYLEVYESAFETATKTRDMVVEIATDASLSVEERAERIKFVIDNLGTYLDGSSVELGEISINLYNSFVESEQLIAEENLGALTEVFNLMREESLATSEAIFENTGIVRDNIVSNTEEISASIEDGFATTGENISSIVDDTVTNIGDGFSNLGSSTQDTVSDIQGQVDNALSNVQSGFEDTQQNIFGVTENIGQGILQTMTGTEENIGNGLKRISHDISEKFIDEGSVKESLLQVISTIDDRFNLSKENILVKVGEIDESLRGAYENISGSGGYLDQFSDATNAALQIAGDSYQTFAQNSIDYSTQQLEKLRETTQDWKQDLNTLRGEIDRCAKDIGTWKNAIDKAINSSVKLFNASNAVQQSLSGEGAYAAGAGAMLDVLASSADNVGSSIASMANSIENSYQSINSARQAAADAYRDMGAAASEAAGQYQNMGYSAADARNLADEATAAAKLALQTLAQLPGRAVTAWTGRAQITVPQLNLDEMKAPWSWGGFASGGYTGSWTDRGVDDKNGKWAVLHQKELVLNQADTRNMLSAVELVRDIMSGVNSLPTVGKNTITNAGYNNTVDQRVEINATFPGVTEAIEIKQALEQLADNAYQEAHRYKY